MLLKVLKMFSQHQLVQLVMLGFLILPIPTTCVRIGIVLPLTDQWVVMLSSWEIKSYKVIDIGIVQTKMHDGVMRIMPNVRHILDLKKNLVSLGVLDSQSCKYSAQGGF